MHFDHKAYGERIKRLRTGRDLTQEQLAEKINVSRTYIVKIENGLQIGPIEIAIELAMFFDVSMDFLLLGKENYRVDRKQCLRMAIDILSELEAELQNVPFWVCNVPNCFCSVAFLQGTIYSSQTKGLLYLEKRHSAISGNWITSADEPP